MCGRRSSIMSCLERLGIHEICDEIEAQCCRKTLRMRRSTLYPFIQSAWCLLYPVPLLIYSPHLSLALFLPFFYFAQLSGTVLAGPPRRRTQDGQGEDAYQPSGHW
ncbi:unnamed protein product, partial [Phaeothamnion confervicola]